MAFNPALSYFVERLQGFSSNIFRLEAVGKNTATSSDIITFNLPANAILNLRSFSVNFNANAGAGGLGGGRLPAKIDTLFERVEVVAGGITLSQGVNFYNVLRHAKDALCGDHTDSVLGHPQIVRESSYVDGFGDNASVGGGALLGGTANEGYNNLLVNPQGSTLFAVNYWEGFLGSAEPRLLDSSLIPDLQVRIYMASDNVLTSSSNALLGDLQGGPVNTNFTNAAGAGGVRYQLKNIHATIECVNLSDATYDAMLQDQMASAGFLEIPYKTYYTFNDTHTGSTRWSVASQSVDRCWAAWRPGNYNDQALPIACKGHKGARAVFGTPGIGSLGFIATDNAAPPVFTTKSNLGVNEFDSGGVAGLDNDNEKYVGPYYNFMQPNVSARYQWQLNGANIPQSKLDARDMYQVAKGATQGYRLEKEMSLCQYLNNYCVQCIRLNLVDSEYSRLISGLDTRAVNLQGSLNTDNVTTAGAPGGVAPNVCLFIECTASLKVGMGRAIEVIH
jgi:hypothetical protein